MAFTQFFVRPSVWMYFCPSARPSVQSGAQLGRGALGARAFKTLGEVIYYHLPYYKYLRPHLKLPSCAPASLTR